MNTKIITRHAKGLLGLSSILIATFHYTASALPVVVDTAVNPANNHTYYLLSNSTWTDAQAAAVGLGGNLATVNNAAENTWIWDKWGTGHDLWIGLYDPIFGDGNGPQHAANFRWVSGETATFRNWRTDEPNNVNNGYYTYIWAKPLVPGGVWNDIDNVLSTPDEPAMFGVVEVVPEPSTGALLACAGLIGLLARRKVNATR